MSDLTAPLQNPPRRLACVQCGTAFQCTGDAQCWCAAESFRLPMPTAAAQDCLCPSCLRRMAATQQAAADKANAL